ncbi:beta-glucosidase family protein [Microbacterium sp. DT81.1]|uniref:beta-glucosidase family protein n=1 Tax=Microbacterium sp. DT81.1 TaxID=3393413 RepID=UPI003CF6F170
MTATTAPDVHPLGTEAGRPARAEAQPLADIDEAMTRARQLPLETRVALLTGATTWTLGEIAEIGLRRITLSDGPIGVRGTGEDGLPSAQLPAPSATAATWDEALQRSIARLIAGEARRKGVDVVLAPVVNLQRSPVGGRHFECLSEDPLLTARLGAAFVASLQEWGIAASVKHFVANETETDRTQYRSRIDDRTFREVYLAPFEAIIDAGAWTVMAAYNGVSYGGVDATATGHGPLLNDLLKGEWGFDGVVVSDWLATRDTVGSALGGLDLVMPGPGGPWGAHLVQAVGDGLVPEAVLDDKVARILLLAARVGALSGQPGRVGAYDASEAGPEPDAAEVVAFLTEAAARSTVVLRNDGGILPLDPSGIRRIALLGHNAVQPFTQGGGSAFVRAPHIGDPLGALRAAFPGASVELARGGVTTVGAPSIPPEGVRTPDGTAGILVEELDAGGAVRSAHVLADPAHIWFPIEDDAVVRVRLTADVLLEASGEHALEVAPVGAHDVRVDGASIGSSDVRVGAEVVLDSSYANPETRTAHLAIDDPRAVRVEVDAQVVDADAYGRFVRVHLRHRTPGPSIDEELDAAVAAAAAADVAVVVVGTNPETESEGWDRPDLALPGRQNELVRRVAAANPRTVVVVNAGAPVLLPWLDDVAAVLWWWLPGQEAGASLAAVLTGAIEPSGRLPWTLPADEADVPVPHGRPHAGYIDYTEGVDVGHRGWDRLERTPAREFGFGLGFGSWRYERLELTSGTAPDTTPGTTSDTDAFLTARVTIRNTGDRDAREVVQVYLEAPGGDPERPVRWLAGFAVADVAAGGSASVDVPIARRSFETWSVDRSAWILPSGAYRVRTGRSSRDLRLAAPHTIAD